MTHLLYELACNPNLELEIRYEITRLLQRQRKKQKNRDHYMRMEIKRLRMERGKGA